MHGLHRQDARVVQSDMGAKTQSLNSKLRRRGPQRGPSALPYCGCCKKLTFMGNVLQQVIVWKNPLVVGALYGPCKGNVIILEQLVAELL